MKKNLRPFIVALTGFFLTVSTIAATEYRTSQVRSLNSYAANTQAEAQEKTDVSTEEQRTNLTNDTTPSAETTTNKAEVAPAQSQATKSTPVIVQAPKNTVASRGGKALVTSQVKQAEPKKTETLDWWKSARNVFAIGDVATVKDLYTGKTFKVKRTMGSNHADAEALTAEDTKIIKSIWGGFSWDRRPIHIYVDGRVLAASMSAMPHAGIDSAPAYSYVKNRSEGYGAGENLDVIKGNGMDGHFDIHFLNSTRHKDGDKDSDHQAMIKIASQR